MGYEYANRKRQPDAHSVQPEGFVDRQTVSNSAMSAMLGYAPDAARSETDALGAAVLGRLPHYAERAQAQIPQAESEADRLSASVVSDSPDAVKAEMGRRLGADFSGIRFHTDDGAALKTDSMGALAYTSGADVYFGSGGFEPGIAAHELVHTVQQGVVAGSAPTVSAPLGGIQMVKGLRSNPKEVLTAKQTAKNRKANAQLLKMGPEAIDRILNGKGGFFERRKFKSLMETLNGEAAAYTNKEDYNKGELSMLSMAMLYNSGEAGKKFLTDRVVGNLANHVSAYNTQLQAQGKKDGVGYDQYMRDLQNASLREVGGGAVKEYSRLATVLSQPALDQIAQSIDVQAPPGVLEASKEDPEILKSSADAFARQQYTQLPRIMSTGDTDELREVNGAAMEKLRESMPDLFNSEHEDMAKSFLGKTLALRMISPSVVLDKKVLSNPYARRSAQALLHNANDMMDDSGGSAETQALRDAMVPGFRPQQPASAPPAQAPAQQAAAPKKKWWQFWK